MKLPPSQSLEEFVRPLKNGCCKTRSFPQVSDTTCPWFRWKVVVYDSGWEIFGEKRLIRDLPQKKSDEQHLPTDFSNKTWRDLAPPKKMHGLNGLESNPNLFDWRVGGYPAGSWPPKLRCAVWLLPPKNIPIKHTSFTSGNTPGCLGVTISILGSYLFWDIFAPCSPQFRYSPGCLGTISSQEWNILGVAWHPAVP